MMLIGKGLFERCQKLSNMKNNNLVVKRINDICEKDAIITKLRQENAKLIQEQQQNKLSEKCMISGAKRRRNGCDETSPIESSVSEPQTSTGDSAQPATTLTLIEGMAIKSERY